MPTSIDIGTKYSIKLLRALFIEKNKIPCLYPSNEVIIRKTQLITEKNFQTKIVKDVEG
jgi:hypothetical protein